MTSVLAAIFCFFSLVNSNFSSQAWLIPNKLREEGSCFFFLKVNWKINIILWLSSPRFSSFLFNLLDSTYYWIDVCQNDGNLLAVGGGTFGNIKIFDKRESKIIKTFDLVHSSNNLDLFKYRLDVWIFILDAINCVRWSPSGDKLTSASRDKTVKLLDFKTGKVLYTGKTSDGSKLSISKCMIVIQLSGKAMSVCFI